MNPRWKLLPLENLVTFNVKSSLLLKLLLRSLTCQPCVHQGMGEIKKNPQHSYDS